MSMSVLSPRLQVVNGLPESLKTKAKGALLVRGPGMRPRVPSGFRLILIGLSLSQVCGRVRYGLTALFQIFCVLRWTNLGLFMQGKLGEAGRWTRWRSQA